MEPSRLQHQRTIEGANQLLLKQELEHNQLLRQLNQLDTGIQHDNIPPEKFKFITFNIKKVTTTPNCNV